MSTNGNFYVVAWDLLDALKFPRTNTNVNLLVAWAYCELKTGSGNPWMWNNPLSTTEPGYGGTPQNNAGVMSYPTQSAGIAATVATLTNGDYGQIVDALRTSNSTEFFAATGQMATWGTDMICIRDKYDRLPTPPQQTMTTPVPTSADNGIAVAMAATGTAPPAPRHVPWLGWGLVGVSLLAAGSTVAVIETDTHWTDIIRWLHS